MYSNKRYEIDPQNTPVSDLERMKAFAYILGRHLTDDQLAAALREWAIACASRGWASPDL
jgi:hypothetical protein